jgi:hypothetical protein
MGIRVTFLDPLLGGVRGGLVFLKIPSREKQWCTFLDPLLGGVGVGFLKYHVCLKSEK